MISSSAVYADVKIKTRQTVSGQTSENTTYIKGKRQRSEMMNGKMISITQCDLRRDLQIMPDGKVYMVNPFNNGGAEQTNQSVSQTQTTTKTETGGTVTTTYTVKDTGERKQMFGYPAKHLIITMETVASPDACMKSSSKMEMDGWYIDAAWYLECDRGYSGGYTPRSSGGGCRDKYVMKQVGTTKRGYPVWEKMTMYDETGREMMTSLSEVVELSQAALDASLFDVPQGYREVKDSSELYASMSNPSNNGGTTSGNNNGVTTDAPANSGMNQGVQNISKSESNVPTTVGAKKEGTIRIGLAGVKTGAVGENLNATELAGAIQNSLGEHLKGTQIELVKLEGDFPTAMEADAKQKECDYVLYAQVSHKKGGGGFGMLSKIAPAIGNIVPVSGVGSRTGQTAGQVADTGIYTAASVSGSVKSKDELTLEIKLNATGGAQALAKQYKAKAKSDGEDIISPLVEQAATAILGTVSK
jgi:hypothetical protein